ncbi:hypothetical protein MIDIC_310021 [Alphaproteobacteria bacterium]
MSLPKCTVMHTSRWGYTYCSYVRSEKQMRRSRLTWNYICFN